MAEELEPPKYRWLMNLEDDIPFGVGVIWYSTKGGGFKYF